MAKNKKKKQNPFWYYPLVVLAALLAMVLVLSFKQDYEQISGINAVSLHSGQRVRKASAAGSFYPAESADLQKIIVNALDQSTTKSSQGVIQALILPHAGYEFSAPTAAFGFKELVNENIDTVIIIGNSHRENFPGMAIFPQGYFETPLGKVEIDSALAKQIMAYNDRIIFRESTHQNEHSIEVQLPFLQTVLSDFKIVPILFGNGMTTDWQILSQAILQSIRGKNVLLIASSDLSHYPAAAAAELVDSKTINAVLKGDVAQFENTVAEIKKIVTPACALESIKTVMVVAKELGANEIKLLRYGNSGQVSAGDSSRVVGYAAIGFFGSRRGDQLNLAEREKLLSIAKQSVEYYIKTGKMPEFDIKEPILNENKRAFVTLKIKGELRGCMGSFSSEDLPLYQVVSDMAIASAAKDQRFEPVAKAELPELEYEVSVLGQLEKITRAKDIQLGKHGVMVSQGDRSGVFLPQVALENNWDLPEFLSQLCSQKAALNQSCWQDPKTEIFVFTAQVF